MEFKRPGWGSTVNNDEADIVTKRPLPLAPHALPPRPGNLLHKPRCCTVASTQPGVFVCALPSINQISL